MHLRVEWLWLSPQQEAGFMFMGSIAWKPARYLKKVEWALSYVETLDGNYKMYHYESDVGAGYAVRGYSGQGLRWAIVLRKDWKLGGSDKSIGMSIKWSQTLQPTEGSMASELKMQWQHLW